MSSTSERLSARTMERRFPMRSGFSAFDYLSQDFASRGDLLAPGAPHDLWIFRVVGAVTALTTILQFAARYPTSLFFTRLPNHPTMSVATFETSVSCREANVLAHASSNPISIWASPATISVIRHCAIAINELVYRKNRIESNRIERGRISMPVRWSMANGSFWTLTTELKNLGRFGSHDVQAGPNLEEEGKGWIQLYIE